MSGMNGSLHAQSSNGITQAVGLVDSFMKFGALFMAMSVIPQHRERLRLSLHRRRFFSHAGAKTRMSRAAVRCSWTQARMSGRCLPEPAEPSWGPRKFDAGVHPPRAAAAPGNGPSLAGRPQDR